MEKVFTRAEATATLPLVKAIIADYEKVFSEAADFESRLETVAGDTICETDALSAEEVSQIKEQLAQCRSNREMLLEELDDLGVTPVLSARGYGPPRGWSALSGVHFVTTTGQRESILCWRVSETSVDWWHEQGVHCAEREEVSQNVVSLCACLVVRSRTQRGHVFELRSTGTTIGRASECEIQIQDSAVSRRHARIIAQDGGYYLEDLKSRNRTYLNDEPLEGGQQRLRDGDRVAVSDVVFEFDNSTVRLSKMTMSLQEPDQLIVSGSDDSVERGSISFILKKIDGSDERAVNDLFEKVEGPLRARANAILSSYPNARGWEADELVSEIFSVLERRIKNGAIQNRRDLYATACRNFRWKLGEIVRRNPPPLFELSFSDPAGDDESPSLTIERAEEIERLNEGLECLDLISREIVEMHIYLGQTFEQIALEYSLPQSTVYDNYRRAIARLKAFLK